MKILILSHSYIPLENQKNIKALSFLCDVLCLIPRRKWHPILKKYAITSDLTNLPNVRSCPTMEFTPAQFFYLSFGFRRYRFKPDIVNIEYNPWSLMFLQVLLFRPIFLRGSIIICTVKKNTFEVDKGIFGLIKIGLMKFTLSRTDHFICASSIAAKLYQGKLSVAPEKISVCHHLGVDTELFQPTRNGGSDRDGRIVIGYCGRLDEEKGLLDLIEAVRIVVGTHEGGICLRLLGSGTTKRPIETYLRKVKEQVDWLEIYDAVPNDEVANFLKKLDVFVLPSRVVHDHQEHDAHALLEAMSCGVACIGTRSGIIPEILDEEYLVDPGDSVGLSLLIYRLITNPSERRSLSKYVRKKAVNEFSLDVIARNKFNIYKTALSRNAPGGKY